ncbi:MAG: hypothetical protein KJN66_10030, partial [Bacteroidia bacterium]|nr:hypothetical protein [Bacteroidia bacterium]
MKKRFWSFPVVVIIMLSSCGVSKFVPEGEQLYRRGVISIIDNGKDVTDNVFEELKLVLPAPNKKILGSRVGLRSYYKNQLGKSNLWNKLIFKRFGEEPVYISDIDVARIRNLIANRLENNGYFYPKISDTLDVNRGSLLFEIELDEPYILNEYIVDKDSLKIFDEIVGSMDNSVINKYQQFSLSKLKEERLRINAYLKDKGYYYFNPEFLVFEADTNQY